MTTDSVAVIVAEMREKTHAARLCTFGIMRLDVVEWADRLEALTPSAPAAEGDLITPIGYIHEVVWSDGTSHTFHKRPPTTMKQAAERDGIAARCKSERVWPVFDPATPPHAGQAEHVATFRSLLRDMTLHPTTAAAYEAAIEALATRADAPRGEECEACKMPKVMAPVHYCQCARLVMHPPLAGQREDAVILPKPMEFEDGAGKPDWQGWNACLREVARLNAGRCEHAVDDAMVHVVMDGFNEAAGDGELFLTSIRDAARMRLALDDLFRHITSQQAGGSDGR